MSTEPVSDSTNSAGSSRSQLTVLVAVLAPAAGDEATRPPVSPEYRPVHRKTRSSVVVGTEIPCLEEPEDEEAPGLEYK